MRSRSPAGGGQTTLHVNSTADASRIRDFRGRQLSESQRSAMLASLRTAGGGANPAPLSCCPWVECRLSLTMSISRPAPPHLRALHNLTNYCHGEDDEHVSLECSRTSRKVRLLHAPCPFTPGVPASQLQRHAVCAERDLYVGSRARTKGSRRSWRREQFVFGLRWVSKPAARPRRTCS